MNEVLNFLVNDISPEAGVTKGIVQFNDFDLTSLCDGNGYGYMIQSGNELSLDNVIIEEYVSEVIDGGTIIEKRYGNKGVPFSLFIQGESYDDLVDKIQNLKKNVNGKNGTLYFTRGGVVYSYEATCNNINIPDFDKTMDFLEGIQISFIFTGPHGIIDEPVVKQVSKTADFTKNISNNGSYRTYPKVIIIGKGSCNITETTIELKEVDEASGDSVTISKTITDGSVLIVDYKNGEVTLDGVSDTNWSGFLRALEVGVNIFDFAFTGTIDVDVYILHNKVFL